jgi:hypothetical protein
MLISGGPAVPICKTPAIFGASWGPNNTIVFARQREGLWQVSANGGTPRPLTSVDVKQGEVGHLLPHILPDGKAVLFTIQKSTFSWDNAQIVVRSLVTGAQTPLIDGGADARYVPTGHLVYARMGTLMAAPFDVGHLTLTGGAVGIEDGVMQAVNAPNGDTDTGAAQFSVSGSGALIYVPGPGQRALTGLGGPGGCHPADGGSGPRLCKSPVLTERPAAGPLYSRHGPKCLGVRPTSRDIDPPNDGWAKCPTSLDNGRPAGGVQLEHGGSSQFVLEAGRLQRGGRAADDQ